MEKMFCMLRGSIAANYFADFKHEIVYEVKPLNGSDFEVRTKSMLTTWVPFSGDSFKDYFFLCQENGDPLPGSTTEVKETPSSIASRKDQSLDMSKPEPEPLHIKMQAVEVVSMFGLENNYYVASAVVCLLNGGSNPEAVDAAINFLRLSRDARK